MLSLSGESSTMVTLCDSPPILVQGCMVLFLGSVRCKMCNVSQLWRTGCLHLQVCESGVMRVKVKGTVVGSSSAPSVLCIIIINCGGRHTLHTQAR